MSQAMYYSPLSGHLGQAVAPPGDGMTAELQAQYRKLREGCITYFGTEFCNRVLPHNVYYAMGQPQKAIPWWGWAIIGLLAGRILRI